MATLNYKDIVDNIIAHDGRYEGDPNEPRAIKVVEYTNAWEKTCWGVVYENDPDPFRYEFESEFVHRPKVIWEAT